MAGISPLTALAELMLGKSGKAFLKAGTREVPPSIDALLQQARDNGVRIEPKMPLATDPRSVKKTVEISTLAQPLSGGPRSRAAYYLDYHDPATLDKLMAEEERRLDPAFDDGPSRNLPAVPIDAWNDPAWREQVLQRAPKGQRLSVLNAMGTGDFVPGTGDQLYPYALDWQLLDPNAMNMVTRLTPENLNRFPRTQIKQMIRSGGDWSNKSLPPYDFFEDPLAELQKSPTDRLASWLDIYHNSLQQRMANIGANLPDLALDKSISPSEAASFLRQKGVPQMGTDSVRQFRGLTAAQDGDEAEMAKNLGGAFRRGGLAGLA